MQELGRGLLKEQITELMAKYERSHAVDAYTAYDWHVWPMLRIGLSYKLRLPPALCERPEPSRPAPEGGVVRRVGRSVLSRAPGPIRKTAWSVLRSYRAWRDLRRSLRQDPERHDRPDAPGRDVVILTPSSWRFEGRGGSYNIRSEPLAELLSAKQAGHVVWEYGPERGPRHAPSAWISKQLAWECAFRRDLPPLPEPAWFKEYATWASALLAEPVTWVTTDCHIRQLQLESLVLGKWMKRTGARAFVVVCWYGRLPMAGTLAASRLGIRSCDLQHGLQDAGHFAYASWLKAPEGGYEVVPDLFWSWGTGYADGVMRSNPGFRRGSAAVAGGNLWLNKWRRRGCEEIAQQCEAAQSLARRYGKSILVTLQDRVGTFDRVAEAIRESPRDWLWLVRAHPSMGAGRGAVEGMFRGTGHPGLELEQANQLDLYALLGAVDVHVTASSTCSVEALSFGVPTVLIHEGGRKAFRRYIDRGVMFYAQNGAEVLSGIRECESTPAEACIRAVDETAFAREDAAGRAIDVLLSGTGGRWEGPGP